MDPTFQYTHPVWGPVQVHSRAELFLKPQVDYKYRLYADMCGDLWHYGHGEFLMRAVLKVSEHFGTEPTHIQVIVGYVPANFSTYFLVDFITTKKSHLTKEYQYYH